MIAFIQGKTFLLAGLAILLAGNAKADFTIYGNVKARFGTGANPQLTRLSGAIVEVYEGTRLIGRTTTKANGTFGLNCRTSASRQNPSHRLVIHVAHLSITKGWPSKTWNWLSFNNDPSAIDIATYGFVKPGL